MTIATQMKTPEWHAERLTGLGGSDANTIMSGDADRVTNLWLEKRGEREPDDLSWILPVQIGSATEDLNAAFFEHETGLTVTDRNKMSRRGAFMRCEVDGMVGNAIFEAKHVNQFAKPDEVLVKYTPQLTHNMTVCGVEKAYLSVFIGTFTHKVMEAELDWLFQAELIAAEEAFWACVQSGESPVPAEAPPVPFEEMKTVDMTGNNEWASHAAGWLENAKPAKLFERSKKGLKALTEADVCLAHGYGVQIRRAKNNSLKITETKNG